MKPSTSRSYPGAARPVPGFPIGGVTSAETDAILKADRNPGGIGMACPFIHEAVRSSYITKLMVCESPACSRDPFLPTLGELRRHCLSKNDYRACSLYCEAKARRSDGALAATARA